MVTTRSQNGKTIAPPAFLREEQDPFPPKKSKRQPKKKTPAAAVPPKSKVTKTKKPAAKKPAAKTAVAKTAVAKKAVAKKAATKKTAPKKTAPKKSTEMKVRVRTGYSTDGRKVKLVSDPRHAPVPPGRPSVLDFSDNSESSDADEVPTPILTPSAQLVGVLGGVRVRHPRMPPTPPLDKIDQRSEGPTPKEKSKFGLGDLRKDVEGSRKRHSFDGDLRNDSERPRKRRI